VLRYYTTHRGVSEDTGFVELRRSDYIADGPTQFLLHGSPVINDCMYRVMHRFRHIVVVDLDEVFYIFTDVSIISMNSSFCIRRLSGNVYALRLKHTG